MLENFLKKFRFYRKWKGGKWYKVCWKRDYEIASRFEWTQDDKVLNTPWYTIVIETEKHEK